MIALLETFALALRELIAAGRDTRLQEEAYKRAEERLAIMRKHARYGKPGGG